MKCIICQNQLVFISGNGQQYIFHNNKLVLVHRVEAEDISLEDFDFHNTQECYTG